jgi:hypothetical protein
MGSAIVTRALEGHATTPNESLLLATTRTKKPQPRLCNGDRDRDGRQRAQGRNLNASHVLDHRALMWRRVRAGVSSADATGAPRPNHVHRAASGGFTHGETARRLARAGKAS